MKKIIFGALLLRLVFSFGPYHPDLGNHLDWGAKFWEYGPGKFYEQSFWAVSWPNQPPGTIYLFALSRKAADILGAGVWWININISLFPSNLVPFTQEKLPIIFVKLPSILADLGIAWIIYLIVNKLKNEKMAKLASLVFLFNPVTFYNSSVWGQTDAIINFFAILGLYFLFLKKPVLGIGSFIFSLYFKTSLIIFLPVFLILLIKERYSFGKIILSFGAPILAIAILTFPFSEVAHYNVFKWLYSDLYLTRVFGHQGNMLTGNAFNFWALLFGIDLSKTDLGRFLWFNFREWGQLIFSPILLFLLFGLWRRFSWQNIIFVLSLTAFSAFLFLTNMHERYLYPFFPVATIILVFYPRFLFAYLLLSLIHLLNLYHLWWVPQLSFLVNLYTFFSIRFLSFVNLAIFGWLFLLFLRFSFLKKI